MKRIYPVLALVGLCWIVFCINNLLLGGYFSHFGIVPREVGGLRGILVAPLLHTSFRHLLANTVPLLILGSVISFRSPATFIFITAAGSVVSGVLIWLLARHGCHIGSSGLIFCYFGFVMAQAWFQRTLVDILVAVVCGFIYGGLIWGLSPFQLGISWEAHGAGLIAGILLARIRFHHRDSKVIPSHPGK